MTISTYCNLWKLKVNEDKTVYTIFTRSTKSDKKSMNLKLNDKELKKEKNPVYLGAKLDTSMSMKDFLRDLKDSATKRLNLVKKVSWNKLGSRQENSSSAISWLY